MLCRVKRGLYCNNAASLLSACLSGFLWQLSLLYLYQWLLWFLQHITSSALSTGSPSIFSSHLSVVQPMLILVLFVAHNAFSRTNRRAIARMFVSPSVCLSGTGVHCDHTVYFSGDLSLWLNSAVSGHHDTKVRPPTPSRIFPVPPGRQVGYGCAK